VNSIPAIQVTDKQLARLRAQRALYSRAKAILAVQICLSVPFAVFWSILALFYQESKVYAGFWGLAITLLDLVALTPWQKTLKIKAAKIQEEFDCDVLNLPWRSVAVGDRPDPEDVAAWSSPGKNDDVLRNWYPPAVGDLPLPLARVICQRANCWWDAELRRRYAKGALGVIAGIFLVTITIALAGHFRMDQWLLTIVLPLVPVFILGLRQSIEQKEAADRLDVLRRHTERIWRELLAGASAESVTQQSRELQDEIFDHRRRNPLIFDWIYRLLRDQQEELMNRAASDLIEEARTRLNL
jgi:uncharacterized membrane protein